MMAFLGDFTEPFILAVAIWPFASAVLTLPVLAMLYHRENRIRLTSVAVSYGCVLYLLALGCFTLYPLPQDAAAYCATHHLTPQLDPLRFIGDIRTDGVTALLQIGMNIVFFVPLGFILGRFLRAGLARTALMGFAVSLLIETAQLTGIFHLYPCSYRLFDVDDLIWNTSGALLGYAVAALANHALPRRDVDEGIVTEPGFVRRCVAFCIDCAITGIVSVPCTAIVYLVGIQFTGFRPLTFAMGVPMFLICLAVTELWIPWVRGGRTLGAGFVRMSVETRPRRGARRAVFYLVRFAVLCLAVCWMTGNGGGVLGVVLLGLGVFWLVEHRMPYDFI